MPARFCMTAVALSEVQGTFADALLPLKFATCGIAADACYLPAYPPLQVAGTAPSLSCVPGVIAVLFPRL